MSDPVQEQDDKNFDDEFKRIEDEKKLREKQTNSQFFLYLYKCVYGKFLSKAFYQQVEMFFVGEIVHIHPQNIVVVSQSISPEPPFYFPDNGLSKAF